MYAIVEIAGQQFEVAEGREIFVHKLDAAPGDALTFDKVLLTDNNGAVEVGKPLLSGRSVSVTVLEHVQGDKVIVFKKKRRKSYRVKNGHRQQFTKIKINSLA
ncbi:MAG TPA: 50S ribosomal protein L21 [Chitinophagales bacterium]|nr:50S ribosomal protein L21 [Chitinophagales bacterium]HRK26774.1 50S ribosomal protein L21 [Chitinophagales bacterium]